MNLEKIHLIPYYLRWKVSFTLKGDLCLGRGKELIPMCDKCVLIDFATLRALHAKVIDERNFDRVNFNGCARNERDGFLLC